MTAMLFPCSWIDARISSVRRTCSPGLVCNITNPSSSVYPFNFNCDTTAYYKCNRKYCKTKFTNFSDVKIILGQKERRGLLSWFCSDWLSVGRKKWVADVCWRKDRSCKPLHPDVWHPPVWPTILWQVNRTWRQGSVQWNAWIRLCYHQYWVLN